VEVSRLRVLDLTDDLAPSAGRLLLGLGADVVRIAAPDEPADAAALAEQLHWHAGKRAVPAASTEQRRQLADHLATQADVVLESGPVRDLVGVDLTGPEFRSRWPETVHVVVTPFGLTGPRRDWLATDLVVAAAGGTAYLGGMPDGQPKPPPRQQAVQLAGAHAAIAAILAVLAADGAGTGQLVDVSAQESVAATLETAAISWIHAGRFPRRTGGVYEHVAHRIFAAADGFVAGGYSGSPRMWTDLLAWLVDENAAADLTDATWADPATRWAGRPHTDEVVARFVARRRARDVAEEGRRRALPWAEVVRPEQLPDNPQLMDRGFFVTIDDERLPGGSVRDVGFPIINGALPRPATLTLRTVADESPWATSARRRRRSGRPTERPLEGVRVLDLTWVLAGPYATKTLADFGAEVIKVESVHRQDPTRVAPGMQLRPGAGSDDSGYFINFNRNKRSVALNLRTAEGVRILRRIASECDVVIENFSPGMLERWGLTYAELAERNPSVIVVSMAGTGQTGPWRDAVTFADTLAAMSGLSWETRDPGGPPQGLTFGLGDMVAANAAILAVLDHLVAGSGGYVDLSQLETMAASLGAAVIEAQLAVPPGPATAARPNRHRRFCPHGLYRTKGPDRWVAITVTNDGMWRAMTTLCTALAPWRDATPERRRADEDEIDRVIEAWTAEHDGFELARTLQAAGVATAAVNTGRDLVDHDEQLAARGFYVRADHPIAGPVLHEGVVERLSVGAARIDASAPLLGQDTEDVLRTLGGQSDDEIDRLRSQGVLQ
jgi:crotonobetainyl-CoA:carnitine CoA-transferase CaiB-like acyl-CoA transferase